MELTPSFEAFTRGYEAGENQVVFARLAADLDTPVSLMLKLTGAARDARSEEYTSELQSPVPISYAVFCLKKKKSITPVTLQKPKTNGTQ